MKKTALFTAVVLLCISLMPMQALSAGWDIIHQQVEETKISGNVTYKSITRFTDSGWHKIHVLEGNITDRYTRLEPLAAPDGIGTGSTLPQMTRDSDIVAAINGDFFISGESFSPLGPLVSDGRMQSSPTYRMDELAVFALTRNNIPIIDYWKWDIRLKTKGLEFPVSAVNKVSHDYTYPMIYTPEWGVSTPPAAFDDMVYFVVEEDRVKDVIQGPGSETTIPEQGMVVMVRGDMALEMIGTINKGSDMDLYIESTPDYADMQLAIGGGSILVKDGALYPFTHNIDGNHPRTALGFSRDGRKLIAVAVEGRVPGSRGMSQAELAQLMMDLGAYRAINLDGGGSTTMLARSPGDKELSLANNPSDGNLRRISNGISIRNTAPKGSLGHILLQVEDSKVFAGTGRTITVKGYDRNYNPVDINQDRVEWRVSGVDGGFVKNTFYPTTAGNAEVTAVYTGQAAGINLKVLDPPVELKMPDSLKTGADGSFPFAVYGKNQKGYSALIENRDLNLSTTIGRIENQTFISGSREGTGEIRVYFNGLDYTVPVSVGYRRVILENFEGPGHGFAAYPDTVTGEYGVDTRYASSGKSSGRLSYDFTATDVTAASYLVFDGDGITLDTRPERLGIHVYSPDENSHWLRMIVEDADGRSTTLDLTRKIQPDGFQFADAQVPRNLKAPISIKRVYIVETNPIMHDAGEIYLDDLTALYPHDIKPGSGPPAAAVYDPQRVDAAPESYAFDFMLFGGTKIERLIDIHVVNRMKKTAEENGGPAVFAGTIGDGTVEDLDLPVIATKAGYSVTKFGANTFLQLDNHSGGIRTYSPQQWHWLKQQLQSIDGGNLFVILPRPVWGVNGFTDTLEAGLLNTLLSTLHEEKGVNVYVLTGGQDAFSYDIRDGVKFIGINGTAQRSAGSSDLENYCFLRFYVAEDGTVSYQVIPMFPIQ